MNPTPSRERSLVLAALFLGALALLLYMLFHRDAPARVVTTVDHGPARRASSASTTGGEAAPPRLTLGAPPTGEVLEKSLADYREVSVYPPWSRVHSEASKDKLVWNKPIVGDLPMDRRAGHEAIYHFGADKFNVPPGETLTSWIEVIKSGGDKAERIPVEIKSAWLMTTSGPHPGRAMQLDYHDDGLDGDEVAGDLRYTNRLVPSRVQALKGAAQHVMIQAWIDAGGAGARPIMRDFTYAPRQALTFGAITDAGRDGNLVVTLGLDVQEAGLYTFEANVMGPDGTTAIAYAEQSYTLGTGPQSADLSFFGRAFREKRVDGPYLVRDIRCFRRFIAGEEENFYLVNPSTYVTRPYRYGGFSDAEWNSPEKQQTIANFQKLIDETNAGNIGAPLGGNTGGGVHPSEPIR